jgi:hypothetical protein
MHGANPRNHGGNPRIAEHNAKLNTPERRAARAKSMKGNQLGNIHGNRSRRPRPYTAEEQEYYEALYEGIRTQYPDFDHGADEILLRLLCNQQVRVMRAMAAACARPCPRNFNDWTKATNDVSRTMRHLAIRRDVREKRGDMLGSVQTLLLTIIEPGHRAMPAPAQAAADGPRNGAASTNNPTMAPSAGATFGGLENTQ